MIKKTFFLFLISLTITLFAASYNAESAQQGKILTTMDAGGYTYVEVENNGKKIWAAAPKIYLEVGDIIEMPQGVPMVNFYSKSLDKTFESIIFAGNIRRIVVEEHTKSHKQKEGK